MTAVNLGEVVGHFARNGAAERDIRLVLDPLPIDLVAFDEELAFATGLLLPATRRAGLSFGDRACLALASRLGVRALTADRSWQSIAEAIGVEIDLIRAGNRILPFPFEKLPRSSRTTYQVWVRRGWQATKVEVYRVPLRKRLPVVRVPLRETDDDAPLDLQALVDQCYRNGDYDADIDYQVDPDPPLSAEDARWADGLLRQTGRRVRPQARRPNRPNGRRR